MSANGRWVKLCQTCWQGFWPDQYVPELNDDDDCSECGQYALVVSVNPSDIPRDPVEIYGTPEHEAWLIEMERRGDL